jgi:hypothetical protein
MRRATASAAAVRQKRGDARMPITIMQTKRLTVLLSLLWSSACAPAELPAAAVAQPGLAGQPATSASAQASGTATTWATVPPAIVSPVSVDLARLTPSPAAGVGPVTQPAPGVRDPERKMASLASQDLSQRLGLDAQEMSVVDVEAVEWPDSSLGCPAPGTVGQPALTPGYRFVIEAGGQQYVYHTDRAARVVLCIDGLPADE